MALGYPELPNYKHIASQLELYAQLKHEYGAAGIAPILERAGSAMAEALASLQALAESAEVSTREPNDLSEIKALRPDGPRRIWKSLPEAVYRDRLEGAMLGRFAGCTLGAPVEFWSVESMENWATEIGDTFPNTDYWSEIPNRHHLRYSVSRCDEYTRPKMKEVPVDDDIAYTLLGLLTAEDSGLNFSIGDNGKAWLKYLPYACTAEDVALRNLKAGIPAELAGETNNPFCEWIGADIRSDPWGYMAPGYPEFAADMAYRDAYVSHRRNGIYGEMFFSAAVAAAFTVDNPVTALEIALTEIPAGCALAVAIRWALSVAPEIRDYKQARAAVEAHFVGMHPVHTNNNACLTVWGLTIGGTDVTRVIGETVAMGMDNDCTAATAGSIVGAVVGKKGVPEHWYRPFNGTVRSYLIGHPIFSIADLLERFARQARAALGQ